MSSYYERPPTLVAFHESGHAVLSLYLRWSVEMVTIDRATATGVCRLRLKPNSQPAQSAGVLVSGYLAARIADPMHANITTASDDFAKAAALLPGADRAAMNDLVFKVHMRLCALWPAVERVARALDKHGELRGAEIKAIARLPYFYPKGDS